MIITKLTGGLGNQMFGYAAGRRLAEIHNTEFKVDITSLEKYEIFDYQLPIFNVTGNIVSENELKPFYPKKPLYYKIIPKFIRKNWNYYPSNYIKEKYFHFNPEILSMPDGVYLDGYWQSEKYFKDIENIIRQEFSFKKEPEGKNKSFFDQIVEDENSVSLHIRRGDYVTNPSANETHGLCNLQYYEAAAEIIADKIQNPNIYVFSDEPEWAKKNLNIKYPLTIISHNDFNNGFEDMRLMSACRHNIIANSSFSWWGAWLNSNPEKIVIAPKKWFNQTSLNSKDLIPEEWIRL